jgi:hypothetical protein
MRGLTITWRENVEWSEVPSRHVVPSRSVDGDGGHELIALGAIE